MQKNLSAVLALVLGSIGAQGFGPHPGFGSGRTSSGGGGTTITVDDEGSAVAGGPHSVMNFIGDGVTATDAGGGQVDITIPGGSVVSLTGKTFVPVVESLKNIGAPLFSAGAGSGTFSGSVDLSTAGGVRIIPVGATHAVIRAGLDMNMAAGQLEYIASVVENGVAANTAVPIAWVNGTFTGFGEGSITDTGVTFVALDSVAPHIDWHLIDTGLGGSRSFIRFNMSIDGWLIDDFGGGASFAEETFTPSAAQTVFNTALSRLAGNSMALACVNNVCGHREFVDWTFSGTTFTWLDPFVFDTLDLLTLKYHTP